jgi:hypothetical protein
MACLAQPFDYEFYCLPARAVVGGLLHTATWVEVARPEIRTPNPESVDRSSTVSDKVTGEQARFPHYAVSIPPYCTLFHAIAETRMEKNFSRAVRGGLSQERPPRFASLRRAQIARARRGASIHSFAQRDSGKFVN